MAGRVFVAILALLIFFGFNSVISSGIHGLRTDSVDQDNVVNTGAGETTAQVVLSSALYQDALSEVDSIESTLEESPAASSYATGNQTLTIAGLTANTSRTLTINYYTELDDEMMQIIGPFLSFFIYGGVIFALVWGVWKGKRGRGG